MNQTNLIGRLTRDPELKQTPNGVSVCTFGIAVTRRFNRDEADFINIVTWRGLADNCGKYLTKGQQVGVEGRIQTRQYEDNDGKKRTAFEIVAENVVFLGKPSGEHQDRPEQQEEQQQAPEPTQPKQKQQKQFEAPTTLYEPPEGFTRVDDDDLPF